MPVSTVPSIRKLRLRKGYKTIVQFARVADLDISTANKIEQGRVRDPRYSTLKKYSVALEEPIPVVIEAILQSVREAA